MLVGVNPYFNATQSEILLFFRISAPRIKGKKANPENLKIGKISIFLKFIFLLYFDAMDLIIELFRQIMDPRKRRNIDKVSGIR